MTEEHIITQVHGAGAYVKCTCGWFIMGSNEKRNGKAIARHRMEFMGRSPSVSAGERSQ